MTCHTSAADVVACLLLAVSVFSASLIPFFLLVDAEHAAPRFVREPRVVARELKADAAWSAAALLVLLATPNGATR
ncbi:hypothetical protein ACH40F_08330 [Streptomyces sp. NPDC020794]|uniref:hypothetical protein n=1 Tax=unclassified Streptomyces TaxID=2593676 RepID=UPI0036E88149